MKIDPAIVLYYPTKDIHQPEGAHCGKCMMYVSEEGEKLGHCTVVMGDIDPDRGVCGLYVHGKHSGPDMMGMTSKKVAGYVLEAPTHCGNCRHYEGDKKQGPCEIVQGKVEFRGCCNYWEKI